MKRIVSAVIATAMLLGTNVFAAERTLTDAAKGIVKISGTTDSNGLVSVLITNPGYTYETAAQSGARQYMQSFSAGEDGSYEHNIVLNMDNASSGYFKVYVKEGAGQVVELDELYFASVDQKYTEMKRVIADTSLIASNETVKNVLGLNETLYANINMSTLATNLSRYLTDNPIDVSDDDSDEVKLEKFGVLCDTIKELAVILAYNEGKSSVLFTSSYGFNFEEVLKITTLDTDKNVTVYDLYKNSLTDTGRAYVQHAMLNENVENVLDLQKLFAKYVMFYGISNHKDKGYGHISDYITSENVCFATGTAIGNTLVDTYLGLSNKANANYYINKNSSSLTVDNFLLQIESYAKQYGNKTVGEESNTNNSSSRPSGTPSFTFPISSLPESQPDSSSNASDGTKKPVASGVFKDVYDDFWGKEAIEYLYKKDIINGTSKDSFSPNDYLTREQAVKILCIAFGISDIKDMVFENGVTYDYTDYSMFDDVNQMDWYGEYVFAAYRNNIVNGMSEKHFGVGENITRQDIAVMIYRALKANAVSSDIEFGDFSDVADYAKEAVSYMKYDGIINGYEDNTFRPNKFITRAEIAQIMYNILSREG